MALPKQIQRLEDELSVLETQLSGKSAPESPETVAPEAPTEPTPGELPSNVVELPREMSREVPKEAPAPREEPWEDRYKHLEGKYRAEVPRLHAEIRELRAALESLQAAAATPQPSATAPASDALVTDRDVESFGEDLIDLQRRVAREVAREFQGELQKLRAENAALQERVGQVQHGSFEARLRQAIPDFDEVNRSPAWIEWLNAVDPLLRGPRRAVAEAAYNRQDVEAVKAYVDLFRQTQSPAPAKADRQAELKRQVQPTRASAAAPVSQQGKVYTNTEAARAFNQIQKLVTQGRLDEAAVLEAEISAAYVEGRVRD
jgi:hypothetical protein